MTKLTRDFRETKIRHSYSLEESHLKIVVRSATVLMTIALYAKFVECIIDSGDLRPTVLIFGLAMILASTSGLWLATVKIFSWFKWITIPLLLPAIFVAPLVVASYHFLFAYFALFVTFIAIYCFYKNLGPA